MTKPKTLTITEAVTAALKDGEKNAARALALATLIREAGGDPRGTVADLPEAVREEAFAACTKRFLDLHPHDYYVVTRTVKGTKAKYTARKCHKDAEGAVKFDCAVAVAMETLKDCDPERKAALVAIRKEHSDYRRISLGNVLKQGAKALDRAEREEAERNGEDLPKTGRGGAKGYRAKVEAMLDKLVTLAHKSKADATCPPHARVTAATLKGIYLNQMFGEEEVPQG